ncbi:MAG: hypothetical protein HQL34_10210 [Alphaproteobacteria bacterium]|nr:hypothetical protein [Alphaproteobacteria bacterium]
MIHAIVRARERYGLHLDPGDLDRIADDIRTGRTVLMRRHEHGEVHLAMVEDTAVIAVYNPDFRGISTFLPPRSDRR